ncbi:MAG: EutN/CcmL family microcompartment protein [Deltaproteobacteria bacterium]|nr:EutN/CcmL family microcompartment protein [Deltaproteobacteria bacterium]
MFIARVVGSVWSSVKWPQLEGLKLLSVQPYDLSDLTQKLQEAQNTPSCTDLVVCADVLGAGVGEDVVVAYGHAARVALEEHLHQGDSPNIPVDAAIVAIVDGVDVRAD